MAAGLAAACFAVGHAENSAPPASHLPSSVDPVIVIAPTPQPGVDVDIDKLPGATRTLDRASLAADGEVNITGAMNARLGSVSINDDLDDPFQPDILYRGFEASPVLGTPQGLAVYQNGSRVNEAFGAALNWDLIPDLAVDRLTIVSANPVFGLNALGGAVVIDMKNGFTFDGGEAELAGGAWGRRAASLQYGAKSGPLGVYVAAHGLDEDGWRAASADRVRQIYADLSYHGRKLTADLSISGADNLLSGESPTPVQELAVSRSSIFTGPQNNRDKLVFVTLNTNYRTSDEISVQANAYYRNFQQSVVNGDVTDFTACTSQALADKLCQADGSTPVIGSNHAVLPDISDGAAVPIGQNDFESIHSVGVGGSLQVTDTAALLGHANHLSAGASLDDSATSFGSSTEVGPINRSLMVVATGLFVTTPEGTPWTATPVSLHALTRYVGLYGADTLDLTGAVSVTVGGRYNDAEIDLADRRGEALSGRNHFGRFNPAVGLTIKIGRTLTAYADYAEGSRTPTAGEIECADPAAPCLLPSSLSSDPPTLRQVVSHTFELGLRGAIGAGRRLTWSADVFRTDVDDDIYGAATSLSTGYFQNIGATRREGVELDLRYHRGALSAYADYSYVRATFESSFRLYSSSNPFADANGDIEVRPGDILPGIPAERVKTGGDVQLTRTWSLGWEIVYESAQYFRGDEANLMRPLPGYTTLALHCRYRLSTRIELFAEAVNALNARYATFGVLGDPTGVDAPGIPAGATSNGPGVDNRFESPGAPASVFGGVKVTF